MDNVCESCEYYNEWGNGECSIKGKKVEPEQKACDAYDEWEGDYAYQEETGNMPCDTYGMAACSRSCSRYYQCHA